MKRDLARLLRGIANRIDPPQTFFAHGAPPTGLLTVTLPTIDTRAVAEEVLRFVKAKRTDDGIGGTD